MNTEIDSVVVMVCTRNRLSMLADCLKSVEGQLLPYGMDVTIVVADNSVEGHQAEIYAMCPRAHYVHEPRRGYSNIRNAAIACALAKTDADLFVSIDDDDIPNSDMLAQHLATFRSMNVDVSAGVCGPTGIKNGSRAKYVGTNNAAFRRWIAESCRFCDEANLLGAEDIEFFGDAERHGAKMVYSIKAACSPNPAASSAYPPVNVPLMRRMNARNRIFIARKRRGVRSALLTYAVHYGHSVVPNLIKGGIRYFIATVTRSERRRMKAIQTLLMHRGAIEGFFLPGLDRDMAKRGIVAVANE